MSQQTKAWSFVLATTIFCSGGILFSSEASLNFPAPATTSYGDDLEMEALFWHLAWDRRATTKKDISRLEAHIQEKEIAVCKLEASFRKAVSRGYTHRFDGFVQGLKKHRKILEYYLYLHTLLEKNAQEWKKVGNSRKIWFSREGDRVFYATSFDFGCGRKKETKYFIGGLEEAGALTNREIILQIAAVIEAQFPEESSLIADQVASSVESEDEAATAVPAEEVLTEDKAVPAEEVTSPYQYETGEPTTPRDLRSHRKSVRRLKSHMGTREFAKIGTNGFSHRKLSYQKHH